jgi:hypothetical protein
MILDSSVGVPIDYMLVFLNSEKDSDIKVCGGGLSSYWPEKKHVHFVFSNGPMALLSTSI